MGRPETEIVANLDGVLVPLPISELTLMKDRVDPYWDPFTLNARATCVRFMVDGTDYRGCLPEMFWLQEMDFLAYLLADVLEPADVYAFTRSVADYPGRRLGVLINECLGASKYTGENLFHLMAWKRFRDWSREYPDWKVVKAWFSVEAVVRNGLSERPLTREEAVPHGIVLSRAFRRQGYPYFCFDGYDRLLGTQGEYGLLFERPDIDIRYDGRGVPSLWGVIIAGVTGPDINTDRLLEYFSDGIMDGWGENGVTMSLGSSFLHVTLSECIELEVLDVKDPMGKFIAYAPDYPRWTRPVHGRMPDFRTDGEYGEEHRAWLQVSMDGGSVRIPCPVRLEQVKRAAMDLDRGLDGMPKFWHVAMSPSGPERTRIAARTARDAWRILERGMNGR